LQNLDGRPVYSATDLVGYLACAHLTALERAALAGRVKHPERPDPALDVIKRRGVEHEKRYLGALRRARRDVVAIEPGGYGETAGDRLRAAARATIETMKRGVGVVYQATFFDGAWLGHADFLRRVNSPTRRSRFGPWHYEVIDTKLARSVKAGAVLQLCSYVEQLEAIQGVSADFMYVALGGSDREVEQLRIADYMAYYRRVKARFLSAVGPDAPSPTYPPSHTYPEPNPHSEICRWREQCEGRRRDDDHLSLVPHITRRQRSALVERGVNTLAALGRLRLPLKRPLDGVGPAALERVRNQARIQLEGRREKRMKYELLLPKGGEPIEPGIGLAGLPRPSRDDLFFDMEGDPYAFGDGIDYLFGVMKTDGTFRTFWATDERGDVSLAGEKRAFERLIDFLIKCLARNPRLHVYHFAHYEPTALGRLMSRHETREDEVDRLLRGRVFVDLYRVVRQSLRASVESYSLKPLELLYGFTRTGALRDAGSSIVEFEQWLELSRRERRASRILARIKRYNRDDIVSTRRLRDWLEARRRQLRKASARTVPRPGPPRPHESEDLAGDPEEVRELVEQLTAGLPPHAPARSREQQHARWLLAELLSWHRREDKSFWWRYHYLMDALTDAERIEEREPLADLKLVRAKTAGGAVVHRYRFPPQDHQVRVNREVLDPATHKSPGTVEAIDEARCTIDIRPDSTAPHPTALVPFDYYATENQRNALRHIARDVLKHGIAGRGDFLAARDLLLRRTPRAGQARGESLRRKGETPLRAARRLVQSLDHTTLAIQGPPGSGKTYAGARMILDLVTAGKKVGVTAQSHRVISNLLREVCKAADEAGTSLTIIQKPDRDADELCDHGRVRPASNNDDVRRALKRGSVKVAAGTAWLWSSPIMANCVNVLFVDEAGQMSLANAIAVSRAADSLVLLGDPQQLSQPLKGSHPPGADRSALAHLLDGRATMPSDRGLFLETTWRLHRDVCRYTSESFYDGQLRPEKHLAIQTLKSQGEISGTGLRFVEVTHASNDTDSTQEANVVATLARSLVRRGNTWIDDKGCKRPLGWDDVLIMAPYNAQVDAIKKELREATRVGTVDKSQGQQAAVSIYSMTSSTAEDAPRGMKFLYDRNRFNVATSRAQCLVVVVASPELLRVQAKSPEEMRLANALCRFVEMAAKAGA
jgi:uncharacterized protein